MDTDRDLITQTVHDDFLGWYDTDAARMDRALHPDVDRSARYWECRHLIRAGDRWKISDAPWLPQ